MGNLNTLNAMPEIANPIVTAAAGSKAANVPAITARNLSIFFGGKKVLKDVSIEIAAKAVTAIIGPSGCGKSTFLRALNRMHELNAEARRGGFFCSAITFIHDRSNPSSSAAASAWSSRNQIRFRPCPSRKTSRLAYA